MFNPRVRAGWLWVDVPESDGDYCVGGYWSYETEVFPMPIYPPRRGYEQRRYDITGRNDEIVFRVDYEWRNYDVPPEGRPVEAVRLSGSAPEPIPHEDPEKRYVTLEVGGEERVLLCRADMLPAAIWTFEEGFVPLTQEEEQLTPGSRPSGRCCKALSGTRKPPKRRGPPRRWGGTWSSVTVKALILTAFI